MSLVRFRSGLALAALFALTGVCHAAVVSDLWHADGRGTPKIQFDPSWSAPAGLTGAAAAEAYLTEKAALYQVSDFRPSRVQESLLGVHHAYQQTLHGIDVEGAEVVVSLSKKDGSVYRVFNNTYPVKSAPPAAAPLDAETIYDRAWQALRAQGDLLAEPRQRVAYVPVGETFQLQAIVELELTSPYGGWRVRLDGVTGDVLAIEDTHIDRVKQSGPTVEERLAGQTGAPADRRTAFRRFADQVWVPETGNRASGTGIVFDPDPRTTLQSETLQDGSPSSAFNGSYFTRNLLDITFNGSTYSLTGPWITIANWDPPNTPPSTDPDGNWTATRGNNAFNDALVYFHVDQNQRYMQALGFTGSTGIQEGSIVTDTDGVNGADNSYYQPGSNRMSFGHGCVDDSEDADVVLHEYGHAIQHSINPSWGGGDTGAMGEGFGDYWAGSYSYSALNGETFHPEWVFSWDGHGVPALCWNGRILNAFGAQYVPGTTYGAHQGIPGGYQSDELWSTPLFQTLIAVTDLGYSRESVDQIILESHFGLGSGLTMPELATVTIATAGELQPGLPHAEVFIQKFLVHNIIDVPAANLVFGGVTVSEAGGNGVPDPGETVHLQVTVENEGTLGAVDISAVLTAETPGIVVVEDASAYPDLPPGGSGVNVVDYVLTIPADFGCGEKVDLTLHVDYQGASLSSTALGFELGTGVVLGVSQSIEPGLAIPDNFPTGVTSVMTISGTGAVVTADFNVDIDITHTYIGDLIVRLISPLGTTVTLHNRSGGSTDNLIGNYPGTLTPAQPLSAFLGQPLDGNWTMFVSDNAGIDVGTLNMWGINDIQGYDCEAPAGAPEAGEAWTFALQPAQPNPFRAETALRFSTARADVPVRLEVLDVTGRVVRTLAEGRLDAGAHTLVWNGADDAGRLLPSGLYFLRLEQGAQTVTRKLLRVR